MKNYLAMTLLFSAAAVSSSCNPGAYWRFESMNELKDIAGGFPVISVQGISSKGGKVGNAMNFQGSLSYMVIGENACGKDIDRLYDDGEFSIFFWVYLSSPPDDSIFKAVYSDRYLSLVFRDAHLMLYTSGGDDWIRAKAKTELDRNKWHHVGVTVKDGEATFYDAGRPDGRGDAAEEIETDEDYPTMIGGFSIDGMLDELAIYDCALSPEEVKDIYDESKAENPYPM